MHVSGVRWISTEYAGGSANSQQAQETSRTRNTVNSKIQQELDSRIHFTDHVFKFSRAPKVDYNFNSLALTTPAMSAVH